MCVHPPPRYDIYTPYALSWHRSPPFTLHPLPARSTGVIREQRNTEVHGVFTQAGVRHSASVTCKSDAMHLQESTKYMQGPFRARWCASAPRELQAIHTGERDGERGGEWPSGTA
eukprot:1609540-Prymnesium_polylepis.1